MNAILNPEIREIIDAVHYRPALSLILPLETHISLKSEMARVLKIKADKAERELRQYYPEEQCEAVMEKLHTLIDRLDIPPKKKGMAIYVSPLFEKILYLDNPVEEKLIVDESFEVRDLLYNAKQAIPFLLLILSGQECKLFLGDRDTLRPLPSNIPKSIYDYVMDGPERMGNFPDSSGDKHTAIDNFLRHIDEELGNVIQEHHLPVLVMGAERIIGQFKKLSKHTASVIGYVAGNYENASVAELTGLISPYIAAWKIKNHQQLLDSLEEAAGQHRVAKGILEVWKAAHSAKGKLLVVEKNYCFPAQHGPEPGVIEAAAEPYDHFAYIRDAVDDVLEKVLATGGEVEFVEDGSLAQFEHIALIKYYP
ncbi:hypothetical protein [Mucilaginibacter aquariorum]|uniref:eRF1 domain-containing protein n=1 Tax=Mucilaginibacter aquariorum TaxID=2967225 RepID=A0ABT1TAH7_9SPHI|nr:hypothetical protein [Mucilaginibacter aquariorum]MCQ6961621.1 hypothetical protein [Mucilaginibacter aquariorum]